MIEKNKSQDWANLSRYKNENKDLELAAANQKRIVFFGDSITEAWKSINPDFFAKHTYINRGISSQTSSQMLVRFRADVIALQPKIVVILAGTNDIAQNTGPISIENILGNLISFCELSKANQIQVVLCSVLPADDYPWRRGLAPSKKIKELNQLIKDYAASNAITYVNYYSSMVDEYSAMKSQYSEDGVHPNARGYTLMESIIIPVLNKLQKD